VFATQKNSKKHPGFWQLQIDLEKDLLLITSLLDYSLVYQFKLQPTKSVGPFEVYKKSTKQTATVKQ